MRTSPVFLSALLAGAVCLWTAPAAAAESASADIEIPENLDPEGDNLPVAVDAAADHFDDHGYPENAEGLLAVHREEAGFMVHLENVSDPFLLYAQFVNRQRDGVFLARTGAVHDPLPDGGQMVVPYGYGALKTSSTWVSLVEGLTMPHVSDMRKEYRLFPLQDLYLGASFGLSGLTGLLQYVYAEKAVAYAQVGVSVLGGVGAGLFGPYSYYLFPIHLGGGLRFPGLLEGLLGRNHWTVGADLLLGLGDADGKPSTPAFVWLPGIFFDLEMEDLLRRDFPRGRTEGRDGYREDPRPADYRVQAPFFRFALYMDAQNGAETGFLKLDLSLGWRFNLNGPKIPEHPFKETRVVYLDDEYRRQVRLQREQRLERLHRSGSGI